MSEKMRIEKDSMGEMQVPESALWGASTQRAVENFPIAGRGVPAEVVHAFGLLKSACAKVNLLLGKLDGKRAKAIIEAACDQTVLKGISLGESLQPKAMIEIEKKGVKLMTWSPEMLAAFEKAWNEVAAEQAAKSPEFKKAWDSLSAFRKEYKIWKDRAYLQ